MFDGAENRQQAEIKTEDGKKDKYLLYYDGETVGGKVNITLKKPGSKLEHQGIKIELIGEYSCYRCSRRRCCALFVWMRNDPPPIAVCVHVPTQSLVISLHRGGRVSVLACVCVCTQTLVCANFA